MRFRFSLLHLMILITLLGVIFGEAVVIVQSRREHEVMRQELNQQKAETKRLERGVLFERHVGEMHYYHTSEIPK